MKTKKQILIIDNLSVETSYDFYKEQVQGTIFIPNEVDNIEILSIEEGTIDDLCEYIDSRKGDFYHELKEKILESYD